MIIEANDAEDVFLATFDLGNIRSYRQRETWGNAYRRPRLYEMITKEVVEPPFVRDDAKR